MKKLAWGVWLVLFALVFATVAMPAWGQEVTGAIVGTISDPSGGPISGATVTAKDTERGTAWTATTNDTGAFSLLRFPVGTYTVRVTSTGFQSAVQPPFPLVLNQTARGDVQMKLGQAWETVEVTSAAPVLQTQSVAVSPLIAATTNVSLPLASRNYL